MIAMPIDSASYVTFGGSNLAWGLVPPLHRVSITTSEMTVVLASSGTADGSTVHDSAYGVSSIGAVMTEYVADRSTRVVVGDAGLATVCASVEGLLPQPLIATTEAQIATRMEWRTTRADCPMSSVVSTTPIGRYGAENG